MALSKKERTMDLYIDAAATVYLLDEMLSNASIALSKVLPKRDSDRLFAATKALICIRDIAERRMLEDHPEISNKDYEHVFYSVSGHYGELEGKVFDRISEMIDEEGEWHRKWTR